MNVRMYGSHELLSPHVERSLLCWIEFIISWLKRAYFTSSVTRLPQKGHTEIYKIRSQPQFYNAFY